jgi:hypothetical protein
MRAIIYALFAIVPLCACKNKCVEKNTSEAEEQAEYRLSPADSILIRESEGMDPSAYFASLNLDAEVHKLKGDNILLLYPSNGNMEYNVRLIGRRIDSVVLSRSTTWLKYIPHYDGVDFDEYFMVTSYKDHYLFRKSDGKVVLKTAWYTYDLSNNLLLYSGKTDDMLMSLKSGKEVEISRYKTTIVPEMRAVDASACYRISEVTDNEVTIVFEGSSPVVEFKIPRNGIE